MAMTREQVAYVVVKALNFEISNYQSSTLNRFTDKNIIIISCIISSISASLSMSAANYLAVKSSNKESAILSAIYTGGAYMITCAFLILPFFIFSQRSLMLSGVIFIAVGIILGFNLYCYRGKSFYKHFIEMLSICTSVSIISFFIGEITHKIFWKRLILWYNQTTNEGVFTMAYIKINVDADKKTGKFILGEFKSLAFNSKT